jgi:hypothetical protein
LNGLRLRQGAQRIEVDWLYLSFDAYYPHDGLSAPRDSNGLPPLSAIDEFAQVRLCLGDSNLFRIKRLMTI